MDTTTDMDIDTDRNAEAETAIAPSRRLVMAATGLLAGVVATLFMILLMMGARTWLGISPPPEALPDRFAPTIPISTFFGLFDRFGGYNGLKRFGITSGLGGIFAAGAVFGIAYALIVESRRSRQSGRWQEGLSRLAVGFIIAAALVLWLGSLALLWPVLDANYRGAPPGAARLASAAALLIEYLMFASVVILLYRWIAPRPALAARPVPVGEPVGRRAVVAGAAGVVLTAGSGALLRNLNAQATFSYDGLAYSGPGVEPIAPNDKFYTVTKNVVDPNVDAGIWRLEIGGMVEEPRSYTFAELMALAGVEQESTLMCISNQIGAGLMSNAVWQGVPLRDLLEASRPMDGALEVFLNGVDAYTDSFAFEKAMDPTTIVAFAMNGEPLPQRHGYPARVVVPGLYGEKNVKWVTRIEVVDYDAKGFYEQQGWGPNFVIPTRSDIFAPRWVRRRGDTFVEPFVAGEMATIRGRAFAGDRGVQNVEFSTDDGETWRDVRIDYPGTNLTWTFWSADWEPEEPGDYTIVSRATDGMGEPQPSEARGIVPQGATGYHRVVATVTG
ncbi:MAG: molybdopterin-dependent oxidoreductase [Chloroflexota bacterium]|nr:molybdopterin-dependent oxidoreductase [Chloroflexota bacterium]